MQIQSTQFPGASVDPLEPLLLAVPPALKLCVTVDQFAALAIANRHLHLERTAQGELTVNPPTGWETGRRNWSIAGELYIWWRSAGKPGYAFDSSTGFILPNGAIRSPDASWVSGDRWESRPIDPDETFPRICPDFVVELRSKSDSLAPLQEKMREYIANGTQLGWLLDPQNRRVEIYRADRDVEALDGPQELSGETTLSGFRLDLTQIWTP
ncbi:MAG: Uma2 family endonuclease [Cyanophyceae cyanobacterium]